MVRLHPSLVQPVGKGRWRGRWRSFQTGHSNVVYATGLDGEKAKVFLSLNGAGRQQRYRDLLLLRDTLQPYLDQLMCAEDDASDEVEGAD